MKRLTIVSLVAVWPVACQAADLADSFSFIQDNAPPSKSVVGHLQLSLGWLTEENELFDEDLHRFQGAARVNVALSRLWNLELETRGGASFKDGESQSSIGAFAHLWGRYDFVRLGAFGGVDFPAALAVSTLGSVGAEVEGDIGNLTLGAQGSYSFPDTAASCPDFEVWGARGWADFYLNPNTSVNAEVAWYSANRDYWQVEGTLEHRFAGTPVSAFARATYEKSDNNPFESDRYSVSGGVRIFMDSAGTSLQEHDRQVPFGAPTPRFTEICFN